MNCTKCGAQLPDGTMFCTSCGNPIQGETSAYPNPSMQINYSQPTPTGYTQQPSNTQQPYAQQQYAQQPMQQAYEQPSAPKAPKKPMPKALKLGLIIGIPVIALLVVFFVVILPMILKADLKGEYEFKDKDEDIEFRATFDEGNYIIYCEDSYSDGEIIVSAGTYEYDEKEGEVVMTDLSGDEIEAEFDAKENILEIDRDEYESSDEDATVDIAFTKDYAEELYDKVEPIVADILANDEDAYDDAYWYDTYYICGDYMDDPFDAFLEALVDELGYEDDEVLQELMKGDEWTAYLEIYVNVGYSPDEYEVEILFENEYEYYYR